MQAYHPSVTHHPTPASTKQTAFSYFWQQKICSSYWLHQPKDRPVMLQGNQRHRTGQRPASWWPSQGANIQAKDNPKAKACPSFPGCWWPRCRSSCCCWWCCCQPTETHEWTLKINCCSTQKNLGNKLCLKSHTWKLLSSTFHYFHYVHYISSLSPKKGKAIFPRPPLFRTAIPIVSPRDVS